MELPKTANTATTKGAIQNLFAQALGLKLPTTEGAIQKLSAQALGLRLPSKTGAGADGKKLLKSGIAPSCTNNLASKLVGYTPEWLAMFCNAATPPTAIVCKISKTIA